MTLSAPYGRRRRPTTGAIADTAARSAHPDHATASRSVHASDRIDHLNPIYHQKVINGGHVILYSRDAEADRAFFRDVLEYPNVDAGGGWLIFKTPPTELAVHPTDGTPAHEFYLMCDDPAATMAELIERGVEFTGPVSNQGWGLLTGIRLPSGGQLGLYEPRHPIAHALPQ